MIISNAIVESATIQLDHSCFLCVWLSLDYCGSGQGFGGHVLGGVSDVSAGDHRNQPNLAAEAIVRIMEVCGVDKWKNIPGKTIRVKRTTDGLGGDIIAIGHIVKDIWYDPKKTFSEWKLAETEVKS